MIARVAPITEADVPSLHALYDTVAKERKYLSRLEAPPVEEMRALVAERIKHDFPQFVAHASDKVVGWCNITPVNDRTTTKHIGVVGIGLLPEFRGKGIGRQLLGATLEKAIGNGLTRIELDVWEKNESAIALYKKFGFEIEGLKKSALKIDGVYMNDYMMALLVDK